MCFGSKQSLLNPHEKVNGTTNKSCTNVRVVPPRRNALVPVNGPQQAVPALNSEFHIYSLQLKLTFVNRSW